MTEKFNHTLLQLARKFRGLSQAIVAERAGFNQGHYSRIENGLLPDGPSDDSVMRLCDTLSMPRDFFYQPFTVHGLPLSVHPMHRKKAAVGEGAIQSLHSEINIRLIHIRHLLNAVTIDSEIPLPWLDVDETGGPEAVAQKVRLAWSVPRGPIHGLISYVERAGVLVIWCDFGSGIDGVTIRTPDLPPCIFLNRSVPPDRMRFSLAHELGHIIMHRIPTDDIENEANAFASEFLMPTADIKKDFIGKLTLERLIRLKAVWRVSIQSLLYHAHHIGAISANQSQYLWRQISRLGWRTREPADTDFPYEEPQVFPEIIRVHCENLGYSLIEISKLLRSDVHDVGRLYGLWGETAKAGGHLRIVK